MRRAAIATGSIALVIVALGLSSFLWVRRELAHIDPGPVCMSELYRHRFATGALPAAQQDIAPTLAAAVRIPMPTMCG